MRRLTNEEIHELASGPGVRLIAVENFLGSMDVGLSADVHRYNAELDQDLYGWSSATMDAILEGIEIAYEVAAPAGADKPTVRLSGEDGNVFSIIARVRQALNSAGQRDRAAEWVQAATSCHSYDEVLGLAFEYVEVE